MVETFNLHFKRFSPRLKKSFPLELVFLDESINPWELENEYCLDN